jgi:hypothetical protein
MDGPCLCLATVGEIARRLGRPTHRIEYIIRTRRIAPRARVGNLRVFGPADVAYIASELSRIEAERRPRP